MWWMAMGASCAISIGLGVWGCRYRELQPISFGGGGTADESRSGMENGNAVGDEEAGFSRGRGRGRGRDGGGEYEMVTISEEDRTK
jgi:hypothetical protein